MKLAFTIHWYGRCATTPETYIADISDDFLPAEVRGQLAWNNHDAVLVSPLVMSSSSPGTGRNP